MFPPNLFFFSLLFIVDLESVASFKTPKIIHFGVTGDWISRYAPESVPYILFVPGTYLNRAGSLPV